MKWATKVMPYTASAWSFLFTGSPDEDRILANTK